MTDPNLNLRVALSADAALPSEEVNIQSDVLSNKFRELIEKTKTEAADNLEKIESSPDATEAEKTLARAEYERLIERLHLPIITSRRDALAFFFSEWCARCPITIAVGTNADDAALDTAKTTSLCPQETLDTCPMLLQYCRYKEALVALATLASEDNIKEETPDVLPNPFPILDAPSAPEALPVTPAL